MQHYERTVRAVPQDVCCCGCQSLIRTGAIAARIRLNLWGRLWKTLFCCSTCCEKNHTGIKPFVPSHFART